MMWGGNENEWVDYSPANLRAFRRWLQAQYGTDQRLQAAWSDPAVTLATAVIPTKAQRPKIAGLWRRSNATAMCWCSSVHPDCTATGDSTNGACSI
jgi:Beta-galactosidase